MEKIFFHRKKNFWYRLKNIIFEKASFFFLYGMVVMTTFSFPLIATHRKKPSNRPFYRTKPLRRKHRKKHFVPTFSKCLSIVVPKSYREIKKNPELHLEKQKNQAFPCYNILTWGKKSPFPFTELIFSWNASRPPKGFFSFWIKVRHHNWSEWKKLAEWGANRQKTFSDIRDRNVHIKYVRLEMQKKRIGFAYQIKIIAENGAALQRIKALFANVSNEQDFRISPHNYALPSTLIKGVPQQSQFTLDHKRTRDLCSPTSLSMISCYFIKKNNFFTPKKVPEQAVTFANKVHDQALDIYGNWLFNIAQAYNSSKGNVLYRVERLNNFYELYNYIAKKVPIAVSIRGRLHDIPWPYENGHFLVVIGWNRKQQRVICIDPAFKEKDQMIKHYRIKDFIKAWGKSRNLSYVPIAQKTFYTKNTNSSLQSSLFSKKYTFTTKNEPFH